MDQKWTDRLVMSEVDDFLIGSMAREDMRELKEKLLARFHFGKYREVDEKGAEVAGRRIRRLHDRVTVDQEKYILEELQAIKLERGRLSQAQSKLEPQEFC